MTREELYQLVWARPMVQLAKDYGLSDVGLRKICVKHDVPTPPLGYWTKKQHGKAVKQPPLPPATKSDSGDIQLTAIEPGTVPEELALAHAAAVQYEAANKVIVPETRPENLHPVAVKVEKILRKARPDHEGFVKCNNPGLPDLAIGPTSIDRAILILDTLLKASMARGWKIDVVEDKFCIIVQGEPFLLSIYETKKKVPHEPTKEDLRRQRVHDENHKQYPTLYQDKQVYRSWDYQPSGTMALKISDPTQHTWYGVQAVGSWWDRTNKKLENYLSAILVLLATEPVRVKIWRSEKEERARKQAEIEARYHRMVARRERAKNRRDFLEAKAAKFAKLQQLSALSDYWQAELTKSTEPTVELMRRELLNIVKGIQREFSAELLVGELSRSELVTDEDFGAE